VALCSGPFGVFRDDDLVLDARWPSKAFFLAGKRGGVFRPPAFAASSMLPPLAVSSCRRRQQRAWKNFGIYIFVILKQVGLLLVGRPPSLWIDAVNGRRL